MTASLRSKYCNTLFRETEKEDIKTFGTAAEGLGFGIERKETVVWRDDVLKNESELAGIDLKDESADEEADLLKKVLNDIDDTMVDTTAADDHESKMCQVIEDEFKAESFTRRKRRRRSRRKS